MGHWEPTWTSQWLVLAPREACTPGPATGSGPGITRPMVVMVVRICGRESQNGGRSSASLFTEPGDFELRRVRQLTEVTQELLFLQGRPVCWGESPRPTAGNFYSCRLLRGTARLTLDQPVPQCSEADSLRFPDVGALSARLCFSPDVPKCLESLRGPC